MSVRDRSKHLAPISETQATYRTGDPVPDSGIYRVTHAGHRLPHEVTLLKDQLFPRCSKCADRVEFASIATAAPCGERRGRIVLYELPEIDATPLKKSA